VVPPSTITINSQLVVYRLMGTQPAPAPVDAARLRSLLDPATTAAACGDGSGDRAANNGRLVDGARLGRWVAGRVEGERNRALFWCACRIAEAGQPIEDAVEVLAPGAAKAGLPDREITATIRSAYRHTHPIPAIVGPSGEGPTVRAAAGLGAVVL
jgi:hypothetical protein